MPPVADLRGGQASAESLTVRRSNFAAADKVDFHWSNRFSPTAFSPVLLWSTWV